MKIQLFSNFRKMCIACSISFIFRVNVFFKWQKLDDIGFAHAFCGKVPEHSSNVRKFKTYAQRASFACRLVHIRS